MKVYNSQPIGHQTFHFSHRFTAAIFLLCLLPKPWYREKVYYSLSCTLVRLHCNSSVFIIISVIGAMLKKVLPQLMRLTKKKAIQWVYITFRGILIHFVRFVLPSFTSRASFCHSLSSFLTLSLSQNALFGVKLSPFKLQQKDCPQTTVFIVRCSFVVMTWLLLL